MTWDAIGAVGEIVGAGAVVISLIYRAPQIRTQNKQSQIDANHEISVGSREETAKSANPDISEIFVRANEDFDALSDAELMRFIVLTVGVFRAWEEAYIQNRDGYLADTAWEAVARHYSLITSAPSIRRALGAEKR